MMDPNIGWFQPEHNGPALDIWKKVWNESNINSCDHPNHNESDSYQCSTHLQNAETNRAKYAKSRRENPSSTHDLENNKHLIRLHKGTPWRRLREFYDSGIIGLHQEIEDFYNYMKPSHEEKYIRVEVLKRMTNIIEELWPLQVVVDYFGSFKTETYLPTSDIDLVVMGRWRISPLHQLEQRLLKLGVCDPTKIRVLDRAAIPIIKMTDSMTGININISFNLSNACNSVKLIKDYKEKFPNLAKLVLIIKHFVLERDLNEVFTGGISSYAISLMVISFFQLHPNNESRSRNANLGSLLMEFLQLYGQLMNYERVGLRIRNGGSYMIKDELLKNMHSSYGTSLLCIEDPLNPTNNVTKNSYRVNEVKQAFDYAYDILHRAVGPLNSTVDQTQTILGRIIRVTDEVIQRRQFIKELYSAIKVSQHWRRRHFHYNNNSGHSHNRPNVKTGSHRYYYGYHRFRSSKVTFPDHRDFQNNRQLRNSLY